MRTLRPSPSAFALSSLVWLLPFTLGLAAPGASAVSDDDSEEIEELEAAQWQDVLDTLDTDDADLQSRFLETVPE